MPGNRATAFDTLIAAIGSAITAEGAVDGAVSLKAAVITVVRHYTTADPLG